MLEYIVVLNNNDCRKNNTAGYEMLEIWNKWMCDMCDCDMNVRMDC